MRKPQLSRGYGIDCVLVFGQQGWVEWISAVKPDRCLAMQLDEGQVWIGTWHSLLLSGQDIWSAGHPDVM